VIGGAQVFASAVGLFVAAIMSAVMDSFDITLPFALATVVVVSEAPALCPRCPSNATRYCGHRF
jgi:hypothetical protein